MAPPVHTHREEHPVLTAAAILATAALLLAVPVVALWRQHHRTPDRQMRRLTRQQQKGTR